MRHVSRNLKETREIAENFLKLLSPSEEATVVALQGDLGAGKTAFARAVGEILGIKEGIRSPTFVIEKIYATRNVLAVEKQSYIFL